MRCFRRARPIAVIGVLLATALGVVAACAAPDGRNARSPNAVAVEVTARRLTPAQGAAPGTMIGALRLESALALSGGGIGGLSGLSLSPDGTSFTAVSDDGMVWRGRLRHDGAGRLADIADVHYQPLLPDSADAGKQELDSEEIVADPAGGWLVSFERRHRIMHFSADFSAAAALPIPPGLPQAPANGGVEALAAWPDGGLLAIEEGGDDDVAERRAWLAVRPPQKTADWRRLTWRRAPGFRPTAAAALPDGGMLALERRASLLSGVGARIVALSAAEIAAGGVLEGRELARLERPFPVDNFEGMAAAFRRAGRVEIYILSDDNFSPLQNTLLLHFSLPAEMLAAP